LPAASRQQPVAIFPHRTPNPQTADCTKEIGREIEPQRGEIIVEIRI